MIRTGRFVFHFPLVKSGKSMGRLIEAVAAIDVQIPRERSEPVRRIQITVPLPEQFTVKWKVEPHFVDEFVSPGVKDADATTELTMTLAQGLVNTKHTLEIFGTSATTIAAMRIYRPGASDQILRRQP